LTWLNANQTVIRLFFTAFLSGYYIVDAGENSVNSTKNVTVSFHGTLQFVPNISVDIFWSGKENYTISFNITENFLWGFTGTITRWDSLQTHPDAIWIKWTANASRCSN